MADGGVRVDGSQKKLNEMNRLADMGHFPAVVNAGATANVLVTIVATWWMVGRHAEPYWPVVWVALVLVVNLLPVILLRASMGEASSYPRLGEMNWLRDQHKFSDWVYVAASANMAFWVLISWALFSVDRRTSGLLGMLALAFAVTFSPVLVRWIGGAVER